MRWRILFVWTSTCVAVDRLMLHEQAKHLLHRGPSSFGFFLLYLDRWAERPYSKVIEESLPNYANSRRRLTRNIMHIAAFLLRA
jgi:hypothetical protein